MLALRGQPVTRQWSRSEVSQGFDMDGNAGIGRFLLEAGLKMVAHAVDFFRGGVPGHDEMKVNGFLC